MLRIPATLFRIVLKWLQPCSLKHAAPYALPAVTSIGQKPQSSAPQAIPKRIWTYWNQTPPNKFVRECVRSWQHQCTDYAVTLVHPDNLHTYVPASDLPAQFDQLHPTKQSDWLRLYLVARHGGFWLDASTLLTSSLDWMQQQKEAAFVGFYLEKFTRDASFPVIESWAFGAVAKSAFISAWQQEFHHALIEVGTTAYLEQLQQRPDWPALRQGIQDPQYLLIHITAQKILRDAMPHERLALFKAEDSAYFYHARLRWKWYLLYPQLCLVPSPVAVSPIVKLRGGERRHFTEMQALHGPARPGSLWARAFQ